MKTFKQKPPGYITITLLFWSFFALMTILAVFRVFGWKYFLVPYETKDISEFGKHTIITIFKLFEALLYAFILIKKKWYVKVIVTVSYVILLFIPHPDFVEVITDALYILAIPLLFDRRSIILSSIVFALLLCYQALMLFARYNIDLVVNYNWYIHILTFLDYTVFLITLLIFIKRRQLWKKENGDQTKEVSSCSDRKQCSKQSEDF